MIFTLSVKYLHNKTHRQKNITQCCVSYNLSVFLPWAFDICQCPMLHLWSPRMVKGKAVTSPALNISNMFVFMNCSGRMNNKSLNKSLDLQSPHNTQLLPHTDASGCAIEQVLCIFCNNISRDYQLPMATFLLQALWDCVALKNMFFWLTLTRKIGYYNRDQIKIICEIIRRKREKGETRKKIAALIK